LGKSLGFLTGEESEIMVNAFSKGIIAGSEPFKRDGVYDFG